MARKATSFFISSEKLVRIVFLVGWKNIIDTKRHNLACVPCHVIIMYYFLVSCRVLLTFLKTRVSCSRFPRKKMPKQ